MENKRLFTALLISFISFSFAQQFNATGLGLGNNYMSAARGVDAYKLNIANLIYNQGTEFTFLSVNLGLSNSAFSADDYRKYFTKSGNNGKWSEKDKSELRSILKGGIQIPLDFGANVFTLVHKNMGFGIDFIGSSGLNATVGKAVDAALDEIDFTQDYSLYQKETLNGAFYTALKFSFAYSYLLRKRYFPLKLKALTVGAKINYYAGLSYLEVRESEANLERFQEPLDAGYNYFYNINMRSALPGPEGIFSGSGFGVDLAGSVIYNDKWNFSIKLINLFGHIAWDTNTEVRKYFERDSIFFNEDNVNRNTKTDSINSNATFTTSLPLNLHVGAHYKITKRLTLMAQYRQGLNEQFGNVYTPRFGVAVEYRPLKWLPLRSGLTVGGKNDFLFGLGTGVNLGIFEFNLSYAMREAIWPTFSNGIFIAYDLKFKL